MQLEAQTNSAERAGLRAPTGAIAAAPVSAEPFSSAAATVPSPERAVPEAPSADETHSSAAADRRVSTWTGNHLPRAEEPDVQAICEEIRGWHRRRNFAMKQRMRADLALGNFLRTELGWRKDGDETANKAARLAATAIIHAAETQSAPDGWPAELHFFAIGAVAARAPFAEIERDAVREMKRLAKTLPVWSSFGKDARGFGELSLAVIVGEAGNLSNYDGEAKLWKRMGVAVIGPGDGLRDHRQGNPGPKATADDWIAEGYNKARRSQLFVIGDTMLKCAGPYREIYLRRKAYEIERAEQLGLTVAPAAKIPKKDAALYRSQMAIHRRAQRYMEKRLLRHLWRAWRGSGPIDGCR